MGYAQRTFAALDGGGNGRRVFSINGPGVVEAADDHMHNIYDKLKLIVDSEKAVIAWFLVDNPIDHYTRLKVPLAHRMVFYVDESFPRFTTGVLKCDVAADAFLPHAGMLYEGKAVKRDIDVLFTSTVCFEPQLGFEDSVPEDVRQLVRDAIDILAVDESHKSVWDALKEAAGTRYGSSKWDTSLISFLFHKIDRYIRPYIKNRLLDFVVDLGVEVHVYGSGWEEHPLAGKLFGKTPVSFSQTPLLNARAKIALNSNNNLTHGSHERVFNAMLNGAIPLGDGSSYYDRQFPGVCLTMRDKEKIQKLVFDENFFEQGSAMARRIAMRGHTWAHRAVAIEKMIKEYRKIVFGIKR